MNSKNFLLALRTLIREEVRSAVRDELQSLNENKSVKSKLTTQDIWEIIDTPNDHKVSKPAKKKTFTKDPLLNDLLNDTATRPLQMNEGFDTLSFSAEMAQGFGAMRSTEPIIAPQRDLDGKPVNMKNENVATVVNAMTKDYSALMKAIDKKKGKA